MHFPCQFLCPVKYGRVQCIVVIQFVWYQVNISVRSVGFIIQLSQLYFVPSMHVLTCPFWTAHITKRNAVNDVWCLIERPHRLQLEYVYVGVAPAAKLIHTFILKSMWHWWNNRLLILVSTLTLLCCGIRPEEFLQKEPKSIHKKSLYFYQSYRVILINQLHWTKIIT